MKKIIAILLALMLCVGCAQAKAGLTSFKTYDLNLQPGDEEMKMVSQDIFKPYDLTIVKVWTTWCGYCVREMPELPKLKELLPENVNLITICADAMTEPELAYRILQMTGATTFPTLIATQEMRDQYLAQIYSFPATCFLDSNGLPVTDPVLGTPSMDGQAEIYLAMAEEALAMMEE